MIVIHYEKEDTADGENTDQGSSESGVLTLCLAVEPYSAVYLWQVNDTVSTKVSAHTHTILLLREGESAGTRVINSHTNQ